MPAKTLEQTVQDLLGAQALTICRLQSELETVMVKLAEVQAELAKAKEGKSDG